MLLCTSQVVCMRLLISEAQITFSQHSGLEQHTFMTLDMNTKVLAGTFSVLEAPGEN